MSESVTIPSDSENYDGNNELSSSPPSSSSSPVILYHPPTLWGLVRGAAINLVLPFVNGLMLGFGELFAHEIAFRLGWSGTKVSLPPVLHRQTRFAFWGACAERARRASASAIYRGHRESSCSFSNISQVFPVHRSNTRRVGPGVQMQSDPVRRRRRSGEEIDMYAALE